MNENESYENLDHHFYGDVDLESVKSSYLCINNLEYCFSLCLSLKEVDLSNWDVSRVKNMKGCFYSCTSLKSLELTTWETSNVETLCECFKGCKSLIFLDIENWTISDDCDVKDMFKDCRRLSSIKCRPETFERIRDQLYGDRWVMLDGIANRV